MAKHHLHAARSRGWRKGIFINGFGAFLSFVVLLIFIRFKFMEGAWVDHRHRPDHGRAARAAQQAVRGRGRTSSRTTRTPRSTAPILRRHVVLVFVARLDQSTARAIQYAAHADARRDARGAHRRGTARRPRSSPTAGARSGCRGSRSSSSTAPTGASPAPRSTSSPARSPTPRPRSRCCCRTASTGGSGTGCSTTTPATRSRRRSRKLEHANVTMVPFQMGEPVHASGAVTDAAGVALVGERLAAAGHADRRRPLAHPGPRSGASIRSMRVQPWADVASLECVVVDETGGILLVFLGRRKVAGRRARPRARRRGHGRAVARATSRCSTLTSSCSRPIIFGRGR